MGAVLGGGVSARVRFLRLFTMSSETIENYSASGRADDGDDLADVTAVNRNL